MTNYDFTINGFCSNCGECCSDVLHLDDNEIAIIENYIKEHDIKPSPYKEVNNGKPTLDLTCPFRNDEFRKCNIYEARPQICKSFKCNYTKEDIIRNRDKLNNGKLPRSLRLVFFNDSKNKEMLKQLGIIVHGKEGK